MTLGLLLLVVLDRRSWHSTNVGLVITMLTTDDNDQRRGQPLWICKILITAINLRKISSVVAENGGEEGTSAKEGESLPTLLSM
jgi:hypothetical protein